MTDPIDQSAVSTLEDVPCNLCGGRDRRTIRTENTLPICRCEECGLIYVSPRPATTGGLDYWRVRDADAAQATFEPVKAAVFEHGLDALEHRLPEKGHVLDVGCGFGVFLERAAQRGWVPHGCDVSAAAVDYVRDVKRLSDIGLGEVAAMHYPSGSFAAVTLWNVLDHLGDPLGTLREVARVLVPGGVILVRVPNMVFHDATRRVRPLLPARRRRRYRYLAGMTPPTRLFGFAPATLSAILRGAGFEEIEVAPALHYRAQPGRTVDVIESVGRLLYRASFRRIIVSPTVVAFARLPRS